MKFIKILLLFCIVPTILLCFELQKAHSIVLEKSDYINYEILSKDYKIGWSMFFSYSDKSLFFAALPRNDMSSASQEIPTGDDNIRSLEVYNGNGKYVYTIGEVNSYRNGGIIDISSMYIEKDTIYIYDSTTDRVNAFEFNDSGSSFKYSINLDGNQSSYSFKINKNKYYGSKPNDFLISHDNTAFISDIIKNKKFPQSRELINIQTFFSCQDYRNSIDFYNNKIFKKVNDKLISNDESDKYKNIMFECIFTGGIYCTPLFVFDTDSSFYGANTFGTELIHFDALCNPIDTIKISEFEAFRNQELDLYQKVKRTEVSFSNSFCQLSNGFLSKNDSLIFLYYRLTTTMADIKKGNKFLFVYSIPEKDFIANFYPIDFIPIAFDEKLNELVGFNYSGGKPWLEYYNILW